MVFIFMGFFLGCMLFRSSITCQEISAGAIIGLWDKQGGVPGLGDFPLFYDTVFSIELNARTPVPEWGGQEVTAALEQDAAFTKDKTYFLDKRPTAIQLIK